MKKNYPLSTDFVFEIQEGIPKDFILNHEIEKKVDEIWDALQKKVNGNLYNGMILSLIDHSPYKVKGVFVEYRYFVAQMNDQSLKKYLPVRPASVGGVTVCDDKVLFGKRSDWVSHYQGYWETVPAGTIDPDEKPVNESTLKIALLKELLEEAGIKPTSLDHFSPFSLFIDEENNEYAFVSKITLKTGSEFTKATPEYSEIDLVERSKIKEKISRIKSVPTAIDLLKLYGYL